MWYGDAYLFSRQFQIVYNVTIFNLQFCLCLLYVNNFGIDGKKLMSFLMIINVCLFDEKLKWDSFLFFIFFKHIIIIKHIQIMPQWELYCII